MKYSLSLLLLSVFLVGTKLSAQSNDTIVRKVYEEYSPERLLKNTVNINPANYMGARKYSITTFSLSTENANTPYELQQKGKGKSIWGAETHTTQLLDHKTLVWGTASYNNGKYKKMLWNENADYDIIYPYVAADSVGGDMRFENYAFSGGYAKMLGTYTIGITGSYRASMSYRDVDPRPKNTTANIALAMGGNKLIMDKFRIGAYLEGEKYTQKHYLSFVNSQGFPIIYNMSGLGNYNELLSGKLRQAYYEGWSYGGGMQIYDTNSRNWYLNLSIRKFQLDKYLTEYTDLNASKVDEQQLGFSIGKFFTAGKLFWGIMAEGNTKERKGTENLFLNDNSRNYIQIGSAERYNHKISNLLFKGLLQTEHGDTKSSLIPFFGIIQEKEKYNNPLSAVNLNKMVYGTDYQWWKTFNSQLTLSANLGFSVTEVYKKDALFSNVAKPAIYQMLQDNYNFQSANFWQAKLDINFHFSLPVIQNAFVGGKMIYNGFKNGNNMLFAATIGSVF
ncbi:DUF6850 family outer membrane beta-barrel protein [Elizabethkingia anophelis]|uniref:DUF6850 family outer membrane beta-barrel protein n=1 Tax=Elizabethkingia anophelis TaxID=1117645 RepID=UPI0016286795|nr:DUF6850 family outer membrane beta-barrel protein [Elizabethkingia anophelis]MCT4023681.1 hypothetical protein [Elizabethkingia anophelis]MCT4054044.1 hypothetical protein [Elizabethkingia anophelis]MCT4086008.1 hypothetical protein [Elizabethkingia anophelis]MCT4103839.1 hypothetical protein [Elizabethkingia anophelis]MCT4323745.1 hypothetical protein [Elizabethkingia anophelis]